MDMKERLDSALKDAMRSGDETRKRTIRMVRSSIKNEEINRSRPLEESEVVGIIQKEIKIRTESIDGARQAGRAEMVVGYESEIAILQDFLPKQLSDAEISQMTSAAISEVGASGIGDMGKVMKVLLPQIQGRAPNDRVSQIVRKQLST
jgi:uncharacterized protein